MAEKKEKYIISGIFRVTLFMLSAFTIQYRSETEIITLPISCPRSSNTKALKVAGLTVLAALLIAGQAFTAYSVYKQSDKLTMLERRSVRLQEITVRARGESTVWDTHYYCMQKVQLKIVCYMFEGSIHKIPQITPTFWSIQWMEPMFFIAHLLHGSIFIFGIFFRLECLPCLFERVRIWILSLPLLCSANRTPLKMAVPMSSFPLMVSDFSEKVKTLHH